MEPNKTPRETETEAELVEAEKLIDDIQRYTGTLNMPWHLVPLKTLRTLEKLARTGKAY